VLVFYLTMMFSCRPLAVTQSDMSGMYVCCIVSELVSDPAAVVAVAVCTVFIYSCDVAAESSSLSLSECGHASTSARIYADCNYLLLSVSDCKRASTLESTTDAF